MDRALDMLRRRSIDGFEIYVDQTAHFNVESKDGRVDALEVAHSWGMALRILNHQRTGFSYTTAHRFSPFLGDDFRGGLERMIEDAIASAEATSSDPCYDFAPVLKGSPAWLPIFDETLEKVSEEEKIRKARSLEEAARSVDPDKIRKVRKASYQDVLSQRTLINSEGFEFSYALTFASVSVTAVAEESGESEVGWDFDASHFHGNLDIQKVGREAGRKALDRLGGRKIATGVYPVVLRNNVASDFLSLLAHAFLAEQVQKGKSPLRGRKGERFFSPFLSIMDDGLLPTGVAASPVDGEGMPSQKTSLVVKGEVSGFLYDRYWANRENASPSEGRVESTGNSRRPGIKSPPGLGISNLFIEPGTRSFSNLLGDLQRGVAVSQVMGLHTVDPISGDFSLGCSGDWIEGGRRVYPVKSIALAGNIFELFRKVVEVGEDLRFFGKVGSPSLLIQDLVFSGI